VASVPELGDAEVPAHFKEFPLCRPRSRAPSLNLPLVPANYMPPGADVMVVSDERPAITAAQNALEALQGWNSDSESETEGLDMQPSPVQHFRAADAYEVLLQQSSDDDYQNAQPAMVRHVSGADAFQALANVSSDEDASETLSLDYIDEGNPPSFQELASENAMVQHVSGADAFQALLANDSSDDDAGESLTLDYIDEDTPPSFQQLANEDDPVATRSLSGTGMWTAANFKDCITPDDFDVEDSE
jgi:hypothetical protein